MNNTSLKILAIGALITLVITLSLPIPKYRDVVICKPGSSCPSSNSWYLAKPIGWQIIEIVYSKIFTTSGKGGGAIEDVEIKSPHFVDSTPLHGEIYAAQPINITVNFNFDLGDGSKISVTSTDGQEWTQGEVLIEDQKTALKKNLRYTMPDGTYAVKYTACWPASPNASQGGPDRSCHNGQFSFQIDSIKKSEYLDMRGKKELTIKMKDVAFDQNKIIVSPGTKVAWVNEDNVGHFVNTETHPEHTYFPEQNSREITKNESFSTVFNTPGQYNYHCSAHVPEGMIASLIVSN